MEIDQYYGAATHYWIQKQHPGDYLALGYDGAVGLPEWDRIPAVTPTGLPRMIYLHDKSRTGASRGRLDDQTRTHDQPTLSSTQSGPSAKEW